MKECFVITSYCDTDEKLNILKSTINDIKKFGKDILVHAHYSLPIEIQNDVNYYINSENFIDRSRALFFWIKKNNYKMYNYYVDFTYSVLKQYKESISYLLSLDYDILHFLNYDSNITSDLYNQSKDTIFYQNVTGDGISPIWFSISKKDIDMLLSLCEYDTYIRDPITIEKYLEKYASKDVKIIKLENYNYNSLYKNEISIDGFSFDDVYDKKILSSLHFSKFFDKDGYSIFGGYFNKTFAILFYDVKKRLYVNIKINDKFFDIIIENDLFFMDTGIDIEYLKENNNITITVNDIIIDHVLIDRFLQNKIELINNDKW